MDFVRILIIIMLSALVFEISAQGEAKPVPNYISGVEILENGVYHIESNIRVAKGGKLIIRNGATVLFYPGTIAMIEGGLLFEGQENNPISISSIGNSSSGFGFLIKGVDASDIIIRHTEFTDLILPLRFSWNWGRQSVLIEDCVFSENNSGESSIVINNPDVLLQKDVIHFDFVRNRFSDNESNIYIEDIESDILWLKFTDNVITGNRYYGYYKGGVFNSPIYTIYNSDNMRYRVNFSGNTIFNNFLLDDQNDTIITEINFGITGVGDKFNLPMNYFGERGSRRIIKTFDHFNNNNDSPFLDPLMPSAIPSRYSPGHIYKAIVGEKTMNSQSRFLPNYGIDSVVLFFNKPINKEIPFEISYHYYNPEIQVIEKIIVAREDYIYNDLGKKGEIFFINDYFDPRKPGYLVVSGMRDMDGLIFPDYTIGKNYVYRFKVLLKETTLYPELEMVAIRKTLYDSLMYIAANQVFRDSIVDALTFELDSLLMVDEDDELLLDEVAAYEKTNDSLLQILEVMKEADSIIKKLYLPIEKTWEAGVKAGLAFYYGDLQAALSFNTKNPSVGLFARYNIDRRWSGKATLSYIKLTGNDSDNVPEMRYRGLSFMNQLYELSVLGEFNIIKAKLSNFIIPSVSTGLVFFYHSPYGKDPSSKKYDLRSLGTAGKKDNYSTYQVAIPVEVDIKLMLNNDWVLGLNMEARKTFTDYIDDVSHDKWVSRDKLNAANPSFGNTAGVVGNPPDKDSGYRGGASNDWYFLFNLKVSKFIR